MIKRVRCLVGGTLIGLAAALTAPLASAAIVTGSWDPLLPAPFVNLGWVATVNLQIDNNCVSGTAGSHTVSIFGSSFGCSNAPTAQDFKLLRAQVGVYSTVSGAIIDVLDFAPPDTLGIAVTGTNGSYLLSLGLSGVEQGDAVGTIGYAFKFAVPGALPVLSYQDTAKPGPFVDAPGTPILTFFDVQPDSARQDVLRDTILAVGQVVADPTAVPEPGSLALALVAFGAAGAAASSRKRRVA